MSVFVCTLAFARAVRAAGLGQIRPLPIALGRAPDFGSGHVQYHVVTEFKKLACLHGQGVLDAEELGWPIQAQLVSFRGVSRSACPVAGVFSVAVGLK